MRVSVQFFNFADGAPATPSPKPAPGVVNGLGPRVELEVTSTATAGDSRPLNPAASGFTHALVVALNPSGLPEAAGVLCEAGLDPTANQQSRLVALGYVQEVVRVPEGHRLSFVLRVA